jgi:hypothetical protein
MLRCRSVLLVRKVDYNSGENNRLKRRASGLLISIGYCDLMLESLKDSQGEFSRMSFRSVRIPTGLWSSVQGFTSVDVCNLSLFSNATLIGDTLPTFDASRWGDITLTFDEESGGTSAPQTDEYSRSYGLLEFLFNSRSKHLFFARLRATSYGAFESIEIG